MKTSTKLLFIIYHLLFIISAPASLFANQTDDAARVLEQIIKVNNYWQAHNTPYVRSFWDHAAYHTGNMEVLQEVDNEFVMKYCRIL